MSDGRCSGVDFGLLGGLFLVRAVVRVGISRCEGGGVGRIGTQRVPRGQVAGVGEAAEEVAEDSEADSEAESAPEEEKESSRK